MCKSLTHFFDTTTLDFLYETWRYAQLILLTQIHTLTLHAPPPSPISLTNIAHPS